MHTQTKCIESAAEPSTRCASRVPLYACESGCVSGGRLFVALALRSLRRKGTWLLQKRIAGRGGGRRQAKDEREVKGLSRDGSILPPFGSNMPRALLLYVQAPLREGKGESAPLLCWPGPACRKDADVTARRSGWC